MNSWAVWLSIQRSLLNRHISLSRTPSRNIQRCPTSPTRTFSPSDPTRPSTAGSRPSTSTPATFDGQEVLKVDPEALDGAGSRGVSRRLVPLPARAPREGGRDPRRSRGVGQRSRGRPDPAPERRGRLGVRAARCARIRARPPSSPRRARESGPGSREGRGVPQPGDLRDLSEGKPALFPDRSAHHVRGDQLGDQPAGADRHLGGAGAIVLRSCSWPRGAARPTSRSCSRKPRRCSIPRSLETFLDQKLRSLGTAACPPYHLAVVIGGTSAEATMKTVKLASTGYLDHLPTEGNRLGHAFRDPELEARVMELARRSGIGPQFGGKYFALDARVIRLPTARRVVPGWDRRLVLGRPQHQGADRPRRSLARRARTQPGAVPPRVATAPGLSAASRRCRST